MYLANHLDDIYAAALARLELEFEGIDIVTTSDGKSIYDCIRDQMIRNVVFDAVDAAALSVEETKIEIAKAKQEAKANEEANAVATKKAFDAMFPQLTGGRPAISIGFSDNPQEPIDVVRAPDLAGVMEFYVFEHPSSDEIVLRRLDPESPFRSMIERLIALQSGKASREEIKSAQFMRNYGRPGPIVFKNSK